MKRIIFVVSGISLIGFLLASHTTKQKTESSETWPDRRELRRQLWRTGKLLWIYGTKDPNSATIYRNAGEKLLQEQQRVEIQIRPDTSLSLTDAAEAPSILVGTPGDNRMITALSGELPIVFREQGFAIPGFFESEPSDVLVLSNYPNPLNRSMPLTIVTSTDVRSLTHGLNGSPIQFRGSGQLMVYRDGITRVHGFFDSEKGRPWRLDKDASRIYPDAAKLVETKHFLFKFHGERQVAARIQAVSQKYEENLERLTAMFPAQFQDLAQSLPIEVNVYESAEDKGMMTGNTSLSHFDRSTGDIHIILNDALDGTDFYSTAQFLIHKCLGDSKSPALNDGLAMIFTRDWRGRGWQYWAKRIQLIGDANSLAEILDAENYPAESYLFMRPLAASLVQYLIDEKGVAGFLELYHRWPATGIPAGLDLVDLQKGWNDHISKFTIARTGVSPGRPRRPVFQKGFCYAHEGYQITDGYISRQSLVSLQKLKGLGADWISITPFGYIRGNDEPGRFRFSFGTGSENDESVIQAAAYARSLGMGVMLKPHVWVGGADSPWPGDIEMKRDQDWEAYFRWYYKWIRHYALLAEMADIDIFCIGTEMMHTTTPEHTGQWRTMIRKMKGLYDGAYVYAANWWLEYEHVEFWDEMDYIGLNCYAPLSKNDVATVAELRKNMSGYFDTIESVIKKYDKPLLLTEIGFTSSPGPWKEPHKSDRRAPVDLQAQATAYEAIFEAFWEEDWFYGMYWWKWPSYLEDGGSGDSGFTPNNKPAERVVQSWFSRNAPGDKPLRLVETSTTAK